MAEYDHSTNTSAPSPTRRRLMSAAAGAAFAGAALAIAAPGQAAGIDDDADLLAACARFELLEAEYRRMVDEEDEANFGRSSPDMDANRDEKHDLGLWLAEQRPRTPEGRTARARAAQAYSEGLPPADMIQELERAIVRDAAGLA